MGRAEHSAQRLGRAAARADPRRCPSHTHPQQRRRLWHALLAAFCVIVVWALVRHKLTAPWERWLAVLAMAGAIGNGIDRALYGYVVDMFELEFMHFAVFNIADIAINVCCILFVLLMLLRKEPEKPKET